MARLRFVAVVVLVLALGSCNLLQQQENFVSFTWDGVQYLFMASAVKADHPYAVGYYWQAGGPIRDYVIQGSASSEGAAAQPLEDTIWIGFHDNNEEWSARVYLYDSWGVSTYLDLGGIPLGMIDAFLTNRDEPGEQLSGSMPGPFQDGQMSHTLKNLIFSVERLPDELSEVN
jgi:hypothetical protein